MKIIDRKITFSTQFEIFPSTRRLADAFKLPRTTPIISTQFPTFPARSFAHRRVSTCWRQRAATTPSVPHSLTCRYQGPTLGHKLRHIQRPHVHQPHRCFLHPSRPQLDIVRLMGILGPDQRPVPPQWNKTRGQRRRRRFNRRR